MILNKKNLLVDLNPAKPKRAARMLSKRQLSSSHTFVRHMSAIFPALVDIHASGNPLENKT